MTDSPDPFAANPYKPPTNRDEAADAAPADDTAVQPAETSAPAAQSAPHDTDPTVEVPAQAAYAPAPPPPPFVPPADEYTHRYPAAGNAQDASAGQSDPAGQPESTVSFGTPGDGYGNTGQGVAGQDVAGQGVGNGHGGDGHGGDGGHGGQHLGAATPPPRKRRGRLLIGALALLILAGAAGFGGAWLYDRENGSDDGVTSSLSDNDADQASLPTGTVEQVAAKVLPSVVQINVRGGEESGSGTGIIISTDGEILTNNHVVEVAGDSGTITVAFSDGTNAKAAIVGTDPKTDLAVIKAAGQTGLSPATLGSSADLKVGQEVIAIGSPFGLESTVTQGIISALNRPVSSSSSSSSEDATRTTFPAVQTDAAINPGNSGGPLVDLKGRVIAINSAIKSAATTSGDAGSIGLGFAIPIDLAKNVAKQLLAGKAVAHAQIGVTVGNAVSDDGITGMGAEIQSITPDGPGAKAGLKKGDIITAVNDTIIPTSEALVAAVRGYDPGEKITLTYTRDGKKAKADVTLGSDGGTTEQAVAK